MFSPRQMLSGRWASQLCFLLQYWRLCTRLLVALQDASNKRTTIPPHTVEVRIRHTKRCAYFWK
eukprot:4594024-Amphidinium_carterae.1